MDTRVTDPELRRLPPLAIPGGRKPRILVADDDDDMCRLVAGVLRKDGYEVVQAGDGIGLLQCIEWTSGDGMQNRFDAIVSDVQMPDLNALEVLDAISFRDLATPIILITAYGDDRTRAEARALGVEAVLDKPLSWPDLRTAVRGAVWSARGERRSA